jgi:hypothetical protein
MRTFIILTLALSAITSCVKPSAVKHEKHAVLSVFKKKPVSIHDEISPRYYAVLDNGDTVSVGETTRPYDTITYKYYQYVEKR